MSIKEIIDLEIKNEGYITLHLEGIFWKAYEQSAFLFIKEIKPFKVTKKFVKAVNSDVVYLGFPKSALDSYMNGKKLIFREEKLICLGTNSVMGGDDSFFSFDPGEYKIWKDSVSFSSENVEKDLAVFSGGVKDMELSVLQKLKNMRVEMSTPMDCMQFIVSLQKELDGCL